MSSNQKKWQELRLDISYNEGWRSRSAYPYFWLFKFVMVFCYLRLYKPIKLATFVVIDFLLAYSFQMYAGVGS